MIKTLARATAALVVGAFLYRRYLRQPILTWGATAEEAAARLPGDELLEDADGVATRAITIDAPPGAIWPWLVQMGVGRGGAYTYDWIQRMLGLDMHNADEIIPEFQHLEIGDVLPMRPNDPGMRIEVLDPERALSSRSEDGTWVWTLALVAHNSSTRLISRNRARVRTPAQRAGMALMEIGSLVMERKMLNGIKQRAETGRGRVRPVQPQSVTAQREIRHGVH